MRRIRSVVHMVGAVALVAASSAGVAAPLRAGASLPASSQADVGIARRVAAPVTRSSDLVGLPVFAFVGIFVGVIAVVVVVVRGGGRSPG